MDRGCDLTVEVRGGGQGGREDVVRDVVIAGGCVRENGLAVLTQVAITRLGPLRELTGIMTSSLVRSIVGVAMGGVFEELDFE